MSGQSMESAGLDRLLRSACCGFSTRGIRKYSRLTYLKAQDPTRTENSNASSLVTPAFCFGRVCTSLRNLCRWLEFDRRTVDLLATTPASRVLSNETHNIIDAKLGLRCKRPYPNEVTCNFFPRLEGSRPTSRFR
nr:hypothetical protein CFP56_69669 [Quercus suber]